MCICRFGGGSCVLMDRASDLYPKVTGSSLRSGRNCLSTLNTTTEVPLSKAPNPQLLPRRRSIGCPLLRVCVYGVCVHCCVCALGWVWDTILGHTSLSLMHFLEILFAYCFYIQHLFLWCAKICIKMHGNPANLIKLGKTSKSYIYFIKSKINQIWDLFEGSNIFCSQSPFILYGKKASSFLFHRRFWNNIKMCKWSQNLYFEMNYPFKETNSCYRLIMLPHTFNLSCSCEVGSV